MTDQTQDADSITLDVLVRGAKLAFENAEALYSEAQILSKKGRAARALFLHQISLEECAKVNNLSAWAVGVASGEKVDQKKVLAALNRHSAKNKTNAYMLGRSEAEDKATTEGDIKGAINEFKKRQSEFHLESNQRKNAALYVDFVDGAFISPSAVTSEEMLAEIAVRNAEFLEIASYQLQTLERWSSTPNQMRDMYKRLKNLADDLRKENPKDPTAALETMIRNFMEEAKRDQ